MFSLSKFLVAGLTVGVVLPTADLLLGGCGGAAVQNVVQYEIGEKSTAVTQVSLISPENLYVDWGASQLDGATIVFSGYQWLDGKVDKSASIWSLKSNGGAASKLVPAGDEEVLGCGISHPEVERLYFDLNCGIYSTSKRGVGGRTKLPTTGYCDYLPRPIPGKSKIVFASCTAGRDCYYEDSNFIWAMNTDGTDMVQLRQGTEPAVAPNGKSVAFAYQGDIWTMKLDGTDVTNLTASGEFRDSWPSYSPDGAKIIFQRQKAGTGRTAGTWENADIWVMDSNGTDVTQLTMNPAVDSVPYWGQDGFIYFTSNRGALVNKRHSFRVWRMKIIP